MTLQIPLTKGYVAIVDDCDADLTKRKWRYLEGYAKSGSSDWMHRVILERAIGRQLLKEERCDHIDRNKLNNRRSNLRVAAHSQNMCNRQTRNKSGYRGVRPYPSYKQSPTAWIAKIKVDGKQIYLGRFATAEEAHVAYCEAALLYHGEFANFGASPAPQE